MEKIPIVEIFESIQAEGSSIGIPSIFVRVYGCTLHCRFNGVSCDTPYAVNKEKNKAKLMTVNEVIKKIKSFKIFNVIFTGGEPTQFQDFILKIMKKCHFHTFEIETNGTIPLNDEFGMRIDKCNISLKLKSSNQLNDEFDKKRINYQALKTYSLINSFFKFVISNPKEDIKEIKHILYKLKKTNDNISINKHLIYLMPQGMRRNDIIKNSPEVVKLCIKHDYKFSPREHIMIWNGKRGQ